MSKSLFWMLDKLGSTRLSQHFYMRQFLYSEIAEAYGIQNTPDDIDLAIETGTLLCERVLEPIVEAFGPIIIRPGYRSPILNDFGFKNRLMRGSNADNLAYHIWDRRNEDGYKGAAACIVVPGIKQHETEIETRQAFADWIHDNLDYHGATFFKRGNGLEQIASILTRESALSYCYLDKLSVKTDSVLTEFALGIGWHEHPERTVYNLSTSKYLIKKGNH